jgi:hypothetical protein
MDERPDPVAIAPAERPDSAEPAPDVTELVHHAMHLERALEHARDIGVAMGIVMATMEVTRQEAFHVLRTVSQNQNRRLFLVAAEVAETGALPRAVVRPLREPDADG